MMLKVCPIKDNQGIPFIGITDHLVTDVLGWEVGDFVEASINGDTLVIQKLPEDKISYKTEFIYLLGKSNLLDDYTT